MARGMRVSRSFLLLAALLLAALAGAYGYQHHRERFVEERRDGEAIAGVVTAAFSGRSDLRVGRVTGTVQSKAEDQAALGFLNSQQVMKAPYSVDYFVDLSRLSLDDYRWDRDARALTVVLPPIKVGSPNVDEGARTLVRTSGVFVSRRASERLSQRVSARAEQLARNKANEPEQIAKAREQARAAIPDLLRPALAVAGLGDVRVRAVFADEVGRRGTDQVDLTRSLKEVLNDPSYR